MYVKFHIYHMTSSPFRRKREVTEAKEFFCNEMNKKYFILVSKYSNVYRQMD